MDQLEDKITQAQSPTVVDDLTCLNCGQELRGEFCLKCGQASSTQRYTFSSLAQEVWAQLRKIEATKTVWTLLAMLKDPGSFVRGYLSGKRVDYINPIRFFFYAFFIEVTVKLFLGSYFPQNALVADVKSGIRLELANLGLTFVWGTIWAALYHKDGLNFVEYIVSAIFFAAETFVLSSLWLLICIPFSTQYSGTLAVHAIGDLVLYFFYSCFFAYSLFETTVLTLIWKQIVIATLFFGFAAWYFRAFGSMF